MSRTILFSLASAVLLACGGSDSSNKVRDTDDPDAGADATQASGSGGRGATREGGIGTGGTSGSSGSGGGTSGATGGDGPAGGSDGGSAEDAGMDGDATPDGEVSDTGLGGDASIDGGVGDATIVTDSGDAMPVFPANVVVPGLANPWLASAPDGTTYAGDVAPTNSPVGLGPVPVGALLVFAAEGGVHYAGGCPPSCTGPDGTAGGTHAGVPERGITGVMAPWNALVGVFLGNGEVDASAGALPSLDFLAAGSREFSTLAPELGQVFFIGDGRTGADAGVAQTFRVPEGATTLYLGTMDGSGWYNNTGEFNVRIEVVD